MRCYNHDHEPNENPNEWIVNAKGNPIIGSFEIVVIKRNNCHGRLSYGWFDKNKILISHSGASNIPIPSSFWDKLIEIASELAFELNNCKE